MAIFIGEFDKEKLFNGSYCVARKNNDLNIYVVYVRDLLECTDYCNYNDLSISVGGIFYKLRDSDILVYNKDRDIVAIYDKTFKDSYLTDNLKVCGNNVSRETFEKYDLSLLTILKSKIKTYLHDKNETFMVTCSDILATFMTGIETRGIVDNTYYIYFKDNKVCFNRKDILLINDSRCLAVDREFYKVNFKDYKVFILHEEEKDILVKLKESNDSAITLLKTSKKVLHNTFAFRKKFLGGNTYKFIECESIIDRYIVPYEFYKYRIVIDSKPILFNISDYIVLNQNDDNETIKVLTKEEFDNLKHRNYVEKPKLDCFEANRTNEPVYKVNYNGYNFMEVTRALGDNITYLHLRSGENGEEGEKVLTFAVKLHKKYNITLSKGDTLFICGDKLKKGDDFLKDVFEV